MRLFAVLALSVVALASHQCPKGKCTRDDQCGQEALPCCTGTCTAPVRLEAGARCWPEITNYNLGNRSICSATTPGKCRLGTKCTDVDGNGEYTCVFETRDNCACTQNAECDSKICDGAGAAPTNKCLPNDLGNGWDCLFDTQCRSKRCDGGKCAPSPLGGPCTYYEEYECPANSQCIGSGSRYCATIEQLAVGATCDTRIQNASCISGTACNTRQSVGSCTTKNSLALGAVCAYDILCASGFCNNTGYCAPRFDQASGTACAGDDQQCASGFCNYTAGKCLDIIGVQCGAASDQGCGLKAKCDCDTLKCVAVETPPPRDDAPGAKSVSISTAITQAMAQCANSYLALTTIPGFANNGPGILSMTTAEQRIAADWICCAACTTGIPYFALVGAVKPDGTPDTSDMDVAVNCRDGTVTALPCGAQIGGSVACDGFGGPAPAPINYCSPFITDCGAHGTCSGNGICTCRDGYTGPFCQNGPGVPPCAGVVCNGGGSCSNGQCSCVGGYTGAACQIPPIGGVSSASAVTASLLTLLIAMAAAML